MIESICGRVDLNAISVAMLYGVVPESQENNMSCEQRLKRIYEDFDQEIEALLLDETQTQKIQDAFSDCLSKMNPLYFELGMKAGAALHRQLFDEKPEDKQ